MADYRRGERVLVEGRIARFERDDRDDDKATGMI
jgi:hypothetical protein